MQQQIALIISSDPGGTRPKQWGHKTSKGELQAMRIGELQLSGQRSSWYSNYHHKKGWGRQWEKATVRTLEASRTSLLFLSCVSTKWSTHETKRACGLFTETTNRTELRKWTSIYSQVLRVEEPYSKDAGWGSGTSCMKAKEKMWKHYEPAMGAESFTHWIIH